MKRLSPFLAALVLVLAPIAGSAGGIKIPLPPVPIIVPDPPLFLLPPKLDVRVAVDTPYDLFLVNDRYYVIKDNIWYVGPGYNGPWRTIAFDRLPPGLRKHQIREIRAERDHEYRRYREDRGYDRKHAYRPERHHDREDHDDRDGRYDRDDHDRHKDKHKGNHRGKGKGGHD